jgi:hypothetical protein
MTGALHEAAQDFHLSKICVLYLNVLITLLTLGKQAVFFASIVGILTA